MNAKTVDILMVEDDRGDVESVRSIECDEYQGFYHSHAMPVDECTSLLERACI